MKRVAIIFLCLLYPFFNIDAQNNIPEEYTAQYFHEIQSKNNVAKMTLFLTQMPKGGDIHNHHSGAIYSETYLSWLKAAGKCVSTETLKIVDCSNSCENCITGDSIEQNNAIYNRIVEKWSDLNFSNHYHEQTDPADHFFNTFEYFGPISLDFVNDGFEEMKAHAKSENLLYIETMYPPPTISVKFSKAISDSLANYSKKKSANGLDNLFDIMSKKITSTKNYNNIINNFIESLKKAHEGIDDSDFRMRFQVDIYRDQAPADVFTSLHTAFESVSNDNSNLLVGVNIVGQESGFISMRDYWLHMHMFRYLKEKFPTVKTDMHAGELNLGMLHVKPQGLLNHIDQALFIANTDRLGHGVDLPYEKRSIEILKKFKDDKIALEILLTSNEFILGVYGNAHPITIYHDYGVPLVIATDDAGVSRNNLTNEFVLLASRYDFDYHDIKELVFNSIEYSFMSEMDKLWAKQLLKNQFKQFEKKIADNF